MSDPGDKIKAAISRHNEHWDNHLAATAERKEERDIATLAGAETNLYTVSAPASDTTEG
jgi:hypothetical protein